jgi:hypothetical protein
MAIVSGAYQGACIGVGIGLAPLAWVIAPLETLSPKYVLRGA